ncbi:YadA-like family protein [Salmonella enterica]|nr:hypothetical protein [Salmonella enterica]EBI4450170.1 hypothetical protein [Salmonella enterica]EBI8727830.1 hypothetical protein [Salmonella enterica]EDX9811210.1 hypothetical protein [Salmonella enterica]EGC7961463.1 hypothetical protein [Salmonella enterica]
MEEYGRALLLAGLMISAGVMAAPVPPACGFDSTTKECSTKYGSGASDSGVRSTAYGANANAWGSDSVAIGTNSSTGGHSSIAIGSESSVNNHGVAIGVQANASTASTATGDNASASGMNSTATGMSANATGNGSVATGVGVHATGNGSIATGANAYATGDGSIATGNMSIATGINSVALGANAVARKDNEVNIGIWKTFPGGYSPTPTGTRTLSGLSDGINPDEAVNKGQLDTAKSDAISTANKYTDSSITGLKLDEKLSTADSNAQKYASTAQSAAEKYTDNATLQANQKVLQKANTYTDNTAKDVLKSANDNTERRAAVAEDNAIKRSGHYTDERSVQTLNSANTYTNHRAIQAENNAVARSNNYTDNRFGELRKSMKHTEKRLNAGIAGVTALSSIPYSSGNNFSYGIGVGNYQNGNAVAAGVQFRASPSTNVRLNISWDSAGNNATGIGIAGGW